MSQIGYHLLLGAKHVEYIYNIRISEPFWQQSKQRISVWRARWSNQLQGGGSTWGGKCSDIPRLTFQLRGSHTKSRLAISVFILLFYITTQTSFSQRPRRRLLKQPPLWQCFYRTTQGRDNFRCKPCASGGTNLLINCMLRNTAIQASLAQQANRIAWVYTSLGAVHY